MNKLLSLVLAAAPIVCAQAPSDRGRERIERDVRKEILTLPFYGPYDWITFRVEGYHVTLSGMVSRPTLKASAEQVTAKIEGVEGVTNEIEVLPLSPNDDRIRVATANAIFRHPAMTRYAIRGPNSPIHILVRNGEVMLEGVVATESEKTIAGLQANGVSGVFKVTNNLAVERPSVRKTKPKATK
ncbi:MAG: BON domain-containing protein [Bryobacteraceae bacterium]